MEREDLIAFARRDWDAIAAMKERSWVEQKKQMTAAQALRLADDMRCAVLARRPDWPSEDERDADLATHVRVSELLHRVQPSRIR
jgi:hypothetical protein